jgi:enoyl-CoA hydratase/carnithine racemase
MKRSSREQIEQAVKIEHEEFVARLISAEAREAITAFLEKRRPDFTKMAGARPGA